jgi:eukaryotic-like serine/threonine-protein kinase
VTTLFGRRPGRPAESKARRARIAAAVAEAPAVPAAEQPGTVLADRYRVEALIGQGGMATVHAGRDLLLDRDVAIKLFRTRAVTTADLRLQEAEARNVASLNHYALTTLFDAGIDARDPAGPQIYLVMERIHGTDLKTRLRAGALSEEQVAWLGFDLAEALEYVHRSGLLHRDIKPANVLLDDMASPRRFRGKLTDFGIAAMIGQRDDSEFTTGTAAYLSPEVVEGLDALPESDLYSLGLVLLEAVTGVVEFPGSIETSAFARLDRDPVIPDTLSAPMADVLRGMTARRPEDRTSLADAATGFQGVLIDGLLRRRAVGPELMAKDEAGRLAALHRYDILDTSPDKTYDTITRLATRLLDSPIALVTLVDADRVWFKSKVGWDETEVPRDVAFCSTTNPSTGSPWAIPDAEADPRTKRNPLVTDGPAVRSYAGAPLITHDGHELGALCVFDKQVREYSAEQLDALADLADLVMHEMELRLATRRAVLDRD